MRVVERFGWVMALLLGVAACISLGSTKAEQIRTIVRFLESGFIIGGAAEAVGHIRIRSESFRAAIVAIRYFATAAIFVSVSLVTQTHDEPVFERLVNDRLQRLETTAQEITKRLDSLPAPPAESGKSAAQTQEAAATATPGSVAAWILAGTILAVLGVAFWVRSPSQKGKITASVLAGASLLSFGKAGFTLIGRLDVRPNITGSLNLGKPPGEKVTVPPTAPLNAELSACPLASVEEFPTCSVEIRQSDRVTSIAREYRDGTNKWGPGLIVLVGSADSQRLNHSCSRTFTDNATLARGRAEAVLNSLRKEFVRDDAKPSFTIIVSGPQFLDAAEENRARDRAVHAWVVRAWDGRGPKPDCRR